MSWWMWALPWIDASAATVRFEVRGVVSGEGAVVVRLYGPNDKYLSAEASYTATLEVQRGHATGTLEGVVAGDYSIVAFYDADGNGVLDLGPLNVPREPVAFANVLEPVRGAPSRKRTRVSVEGERVEVNLLFHPDQFARG